MSTADGGGRSPETGPAGWRARAGRARSSVQTLFGLGALLACLAATGAPVAITSRADFDSQWSSQVEVSRTLRLDQSFDDPASAGAVYADGGSWSGAGLPAVTLRYASTGNDLASSGVQLVQASGAMTTSGAGYLGTDDGGLLQSGDDFDLVFDAAPAGGQAVRWRAVGLYVISADPLQDGDIWLEAGGATVWLDADAPEPFNLADGTVYFLGLFDQGTGFDALRLRSICCGAFLFNVDDVVMVAETAGHGVPLPGTAPLVVLALGMTMLAPRFRMLNPNQRKST